MKLTEVKYTKCMTHSVTEGEIENLTFIFNDLAIRNHSSTKIDKCTFLSFFRIPGLFGERLFAAFDAKNQKFLEIEDFLRGVENFVCSSNENIISNFFQLCIFSKSAGITRNDLQLLLRLWLISDKKSEFLGTNEYSLLTCTSADSRFSLVDSILEEYSSNKKDLSFSDFNTFINDNPAVLQNYSNSFHSKSWRESISTIKSSCIIIRSLTSQVFTPKSEYFTSKLTIIKEKNQDCLCTIKRHILYLYSSDKKSTPLDAIYLINCYLKNNENTCTIYQFNVIEPRLTFTTSPSSLFEDLISNLRQAGEMNKFSEIFDLGERIGHGKFSDVHYAIEKSTQTKYAVKLIKRKKQDLIERELIHNEVCILSLLNHKGVAKFKSYFANSTHSFIVEEYLEGGDLQKNIYILTENQIKDIVKQLLEIIKYIHEIGIVHRDIKLENIILVKDHEKSMVKLVDFGLSNFLMPGNFFDNVCGTIGYTAPEIHMKRGYGKEVDIWSLGVVVYILLEKKLPFKGHTAEEIVKETIDGVPDYSRFSKHSEFSEDFVKRLLEKDVNKRVTVDEALKHQWLA
ncbi:hypothetical protein SteCoe_16398 [Stentor coeruleus]|uniref:Protein kinase domain-containing protein n=1 Tax=Stentor coeruleus TaxID=5963 RepID=A0A1R2C1E3_9CILI|nr:hypothetical protein SteCoe_16398 [Stentor coeruleus]